MTLKLFPFQHSGVSFLVDRKRALLASDPGTGKTVMLISAVNALSPKSVEDECWNPVRVLVLCPKSVRINWEREIEKWGRTKYSEINYQKWTVANWDKLLTKSGAKIINQKWDIVIADESHVAIKNPKAARCKVFLEKIVPNAERVWLATATPASRSALDYYCTLKVLMPEHMEKVSPRAFQKEYCVEKYCPFTPGGKKYEGFKNTHVLKEVFSKLAIRHKKSEVLRDLPEKIVSSVPVEVPEEIVADQLNIDVELVKACLQSGRPLPGHIAHVMQATALAKLPAATEWITNFPEDEPLVIFAWHKSVVHGLAERLDNCSVITGDTSDICRQEVIDNFQNKRILRLVCNMAAGGVGINLQIANTALFIEFPFSPAHLVQAENRVHRIGSVGKHVHIVRIVGSGTVDEAIWQVLDSRMTSISEVGV